VNSAVLFWVTSGNASSSVKVSSSPLSIDTERAAVIRPSQPPSDSTTLATDSYPPSVESDRLKSTRVKFERKDTEDMGVTVDGDIEAQLDRESLDIADPANREHDCSMGSSGHFPHPIRAIKSLLGLKEERSDVDLQISVTTEIDSDSSGSTPELDSCSPTDIFAESPPTPTPRIHHAAQAHITESRHPRRYTLS